MQMPVTSVRPKERTERAELEPAREQLAGELRGRDEAADVGAPERNAGESRVDRDGHVHLERLPRRLHVAGPQERAVPLHARRAVAVQGERAVAGAPHLRSFPIHPDPIEPRRRVESIALIGPPAVDAEIEQRFVVGPVAANAALVGPSVVGRSPARFRAVARVFRRARQMPSLDDDVQDDAIVQRVEFLDRAFRIREVRRVPGELAVVRVPARRREIRSEIDQRVARQLLLAHRSGDRGDLRRTRERSVGLQVPERPERRQLGQPRDARVLAHDDVRIARRHDEQIDWKPRSGGCEAAVRAGQVPGAVRLVHEHRPSIGSDQPLDRHAAAVRGETVPALPVAKLIDGAAAIELLSALAEPEQGRVVNRERESRLPGVERQPLDRAAVRVRNRDREWRRLDGEAQLADSQWRRAQRNRSCFGDNGAIV